MRSHRLCAVVMLFAVSAFSLNLPELQSQLRSSQRTWVAGETSISRLSKEEIKRRLGAQLPDGFGDYFKPAGNVTWNGRANLDWRNMNGVNYVSPVLNQANCGSCVAFAAIGTLETQMNITRKTPSSPWAYSNQHLFACGGGLCEKGWQPGSAAQFLKSTGVPDEACFPYRSGASGDDMACTQSCSNASARSQKIVAYSQPTFFFENLNALKAALNKGPLMTTMMVYEDFLFYKGGVYKHVTGNLAGGHAVMIVGYDDSEQALIVRNSWGVEWGENGFFRIAYHDQSGVGNQTWLLEVPSAAGYVTTGVRDYEVLSGSVNLNMQSTFTGTESIEWTLKKNDSPMWWGETYNGKRVVIDTTQFADGAYVLEAVAHHSGGTSSSQPREVYVLNGQFKGSIRLTNIQSGQTLSEATELNLELEHSPIPFTQLIFRAKNLQTGEVSTRASSHTLPKMVMFWRANFAPVGEYELSFEGIAGKAVSVLSEPVRVNVTHKK